MITRGAKALAGIAAATVALGVARLLAAFLGPTADAHAAVGAAVIDRTPAPVREWAIQTFGTADKLVLSVLVVAVVVVIAAATAGWETRRFPIGSTAIAGGAVIGCAAVLSRTGATAADVVPTVVGAGCGIAVLRLLVSGRVVDAPAARDDGPDRGRRLSLVTLGFLGAGALSGALGTVIARRRASVAGERAAVALPPVDVAAPPVPPEVQPKGVALPSFITGNGEFYRIDTALAVPQLSRDDWRLRIHGLVDREITYRFDDLDAFTTVEKVITLTCVSNPVGGDLIGTATWLGYRVRDLLAPCGVRPEADMVLSTSVDGFTVGTPLEALVDDRDALLAVGMNGQPLPTEHGYPARLVVPGLYGYVSATKWVVDLEVTRFDRARAFWTRHGWSERGPIKTQSRIDVPRDGQQVERGPVVLGGVAWAQPRGVREAQVRITGPDGQPGEWLPAALGASYSGDAWRLWSLRWQATRPGRHTVTVRAVDNDGVVQTEAQAGPVPDGATGWHSVAFTVR